MKEKYLRKLPIVVLGLIIILLGYIAYSWLAQPRLKDDTRKEIQRVSTYYGERNPQIVKQKAGKTEGAKEADMFFIDITGEFQNEGLRASKLSFAVLQSGKRSWDIKAYDSFNIVVWEEETV